MSNDTKEKRIIGRAEKVRFPDLSNTTVHARIDSGARTSAIWGSARVENGSLLVSFFGDASKIYTFTSYGRKAVTSSNGHIDKRFTVKLLVIIKGRKIQSTFTIADRADQVYPVLIGRNVLRGKFIVDVTLGKTLKIAEKEKSASLQSLVDKGKTV